MTMMHHLLVLLVVIASEASALFFVVGAASSFTHYDFSPEKELVVPHWQTVLPDTNAVIDLSSASSSSSWTLHAAHDARRYYNATVPGDLLSDLMHEGIIDNPYHGRNFLTQRHHWLGPHSVHKNHTILCQEHQTRTWIYETQFSINNNTAMTQPQPQQWLAVFEGIKMGANVLSNNGNVHVGTATDQFVRYIWPIPNQHAVTSNNNNNNAEQTLSIVFDPDIETNGRYMACSGGWDWAPYSRSCDSSDRGILTLGIVRPVYLIGIYQMYLSHVVPKIYYQGSYPRQPMWDGPYDDFVVVVEAHYYHHIRLPHRQEDEKQNDDCSNTYQLTVRASFSNEAVRVPVPLCHVGDNGKENVVTVNMTASKDDIDLWWPNGLGGQKLYTIQVRIEGGGDGYTSPWMERKIGFRTAALVTVNDTDDDVLRNASHRSNGSGQHGMYFRINGAIVYCRGANFIPMDQLEGRLSDKGHRRAVESAAKANMNMIRVWGGGDVLSRSFYDACDEMGILVYHDLMFVGEAHHGAVRSSVVHDEIVHVVRTLAFHPSIVLWSGCNECTYHNGDMSIYESFVMRTVADTDDTRAIWPSSPSEFGWKSGVSTIDGRPNGMPLKVQRNTGRSLETHGPYHRAFSEEFPGMNGVPYANDQSNVPPHFSEKDSGPDHRNIFVSEFGASVFSGFESMSATLDSESWGLHGGSPPDSCEHIDGNTNICNGTNVMAERNYPCDSLIHLYFGNVSLDAVGSQAFRMQLYGCMVSQALWMKSQIEMMRAGNSFGALIWQLNENWPTGGWGCIEYGPRPNVPGQIVGGRWKPLMHLLRDSLFRDTIAACGKGERCYIRHDGASPANITVLLEAYSFSELMRSAKKDFELAGSTHATQWFSLPQGFLDNSDVVLLTASIQGQEIEGPSTVYLWKSPQQLERLRDSVSIVLEVVQDGQTGVRVNLRTDSLALYVWLSTQADGQFSSNAFTLRPAESKSVRFLPLNANDSIDVTLFRKSLRVQHLGSLYNELKSDISTQ